MLLWSVRFLSPRSMEETPQEKELRLLKLQGANLLLAYLDLSEEVEILKGYLFRHSLAAPLEFERRLGTVSPTFAKRRGELELSIVKLTQKSPTAPN
jgi:hypothetical protein